MRGEFLILIRCIMTFLFFSSDSFWWHSELPFKYVTRRAHFRPDDRQGLIKYYQNRYPDVCDAMYCTPVRVQVLYSQHCNSEEQNRTLEKFE